MDERVRRRTLAIAATLAVTGAFAGLGGGVSVAAGPPPAHSVRISCWNRAAAVPYTRIKPGAWATPIAAPLRALVAKPGRYAPIRLELLPRSRWAVVSHDKTHRIFAQRTATGISAVLYFKLYLGVWRPSVQCGIAYPDGQANRIAAVAVHARS
ncbi:hypothetical protein acdb102_06920 [Acidothermaceae bacterium B102]|nr:hypothetical protein acdb102_06920 [Acidothermaceae bacterium B102]